METPLHAAKDVDKDETVPRIFAVIAGLAIAAIAVVVMIYSGIWSPAPTTAPQTTTQH